MVTVKVVLFICTGWLGSDCKEADSWTVPYDQAKTAYSACVQKGWEWAKINLYNTARCRQEVL